MSDQDQNQPVTAEQTPNDQPQSAQSENAQSQNTQAQSVTSSTPSPPQTPPQNAGANAAASGQVSGGETVTSSEHQKNQMQIIYILFIVGIFINFVSIAGVVIAYMRRDDMFGTVYASHVSFLIKTFWISLVLFIISIILMFVFIGIFILILTAIWTIIRVVSGFIKYLDGKPASSGWLMA